MCSSSTLDLPALLPCCEMYIFICAYEANPFFLVFHIKSLPHISLSCALEIICISQLLQLNQQGEYIKV